MTSRKLRSFLRSTPVLGTVIAKCRVIRQRAAIVSLVFLLSQNGRVGSRGSQFPRENPRTVEDILSPLRDHSRRRLLRMPYFTYMRLCEKIQLNAGQELPVPDRLRLDVFMTLRYLAGASYLDIAAVTRVPISSIYKRIDETLASIDRCLSISFPSDDEDQLKSISQGFSRGRSPLKGCVGAMDGLAIKIQEPSLLDVPNPSVYYNRKGFFALNMQGVCDHRLRFLFMSVVTPGSSHDSMAYQLGSLYKKFEQTANFLPPLMWIAADAAYICSNRVLTPWPGKSLSTAKDCFNYWLSSARIHIEQAFGVLVGRWGILWKTLRVSLGKASQVCLVCCKLHNFIIEETNCAAVPNNEPSDVGGAQMEVNLTGRLCWYAWPSPRS